MLRVKNLTRSIASHQVLTGVTFELEEGSITGLIGPSGGGKSTLLKILAGVASFDGGSIERDVRSENDIGLMFQEGALFDSLTVFDNVAFPLVKGAVPTSNLPFEEQVRVHKIVEEIIGRVGLTKAALKYPAELSGGMRRRLSLARALVRRPKLVLLDDPTAGLDPVASNVIMNLIVEIHNEHKSTMLIVSHDLRRLLPAVSEILALFDGSIRFHGNLESLKHQQCTDLHRFITSRYSFTPLMETHA